MLDLNKLIKIFLISLFIIFSSRRVYQSYHTVNKERWKEVVNYIDTNGIPGDLIVFYPGDSNIMFIFNYYSTREDFIEKPINEYINANNSNKLLAFTKNYTRIWFVQRIRDHQETIRKAFTEYHDLSFYKNFKSDYFKEGNEDIELSFFEKYKNL
jgi:hypothetical protein